MNGWVLVDWQKGATWVMKFLTLHVTAAGMSASWQDAAWHAPGALYIEYTLITLKASKASGRLKSVGG